MKTTKRILSIKVERMLDESPDTSWLGEYSNQPKGEYSIDRKHSVDCILNNPHTSKPMIDKLERVLRYLDGQRIAIGNNSEDALYWSLDAACDIIGKAQDEFFACDCDESGDMERNEYRYFNTSGNYKGEPLEDVVKYTKQGYARMESYNNGDWEFIGIGAKAEIVIGGTGQTITSGGLWGIESDSDESYLKSEEQEQLSELRGILYEMGFSKRAIAAAVKAANLSNPVNFPLNGKGITAQPKGETMQTFRVRVIETRTVLCEYEVHAESWAQAREYAETGETYSEETIKDLDVINRTIYGVATE